MPVKASKRKDEEKGIETSYVNIRTCQACPGFRLLVLAFTLNPEVNHALSL